MDFFSFEYQQKLKAYGKNKTTITIKEMKHMPTIQFGRSFLEPTFLIWIFNCLNETSFNAIISNLILFASNFD